MDECGCRVYVVDRDVHLRRLLGDFLADMGCEAKFFDDGYQALDAARRERPDLVITDVLVPRLDGLTLARLIKGDAVLQDTRVLVLTVLSAQERARASGADAFVQKPIERSTLVAAISRLIPRTYPGDALERPHQHGQ